MEIAEKYLIGQRSEYTALTEKIEAVAKPIQKILEPENIDVSEKKVEVSNEDLSLRNQRNKQLNPNASFSFQGRVLPRGPSEDYDEIPQGTVTAEINDLEIPESLRDKGLGTRIVRTWENILFENGITSFTVTNIKDFKAIAFWEKLGYLIPSEEAQKKLPYCMYKKW